MIGAILLLLFPCDWKKRSFIHFG